MSGFTIMMDYFAIKKPVYAQAVCTAIALTNFITSNAGYYIPGISDVK